VRIAGQEWLIVLLIVVLIFGARKLPQLARSLGSSAKEFRKGIEEGAGEDDDPTTAHSSELPPSDSREVPDS
jgi:sec-independent protein translocase protein TatA